MWVHDRCGRPEPASLRRSVASCRCSPTTRLPVFKASSQRSESSTAGGGSGPCSPTARSESPLRSVPAARLRTLDGTSAAASGTAISSSCSRKRRRPRTHRGRINSPVRSAAHRPCESERTAPGMALWSRTRMADGVRSTRVSLWDGRTKTACPLHSTRFRWR